MDVHGDHAPHFLPTGSVIGSRYKIVRPLGSGGMASVYLAEDVVLGETTVAIKVLRRSNQFKDDIVERFLREVRLTHKINHENVVRTFDFGQDGDTLFYTMEYLPGTTLDSLLGEPYLPLNTVLAIAAQLMRGISAVHSVGVIHRDLKPANIMLLPGGQLKIADFGIARAGASMLTVSSGEIVGTITYLAPEMLTGEEATIAVDYYAIGAILYQLLTRQAPIDDEIPARLIMRKVEEAPRDARELRADIPDWLAEGLSGLLETDPHVRMQALAEFAKNLDTYAPKDTSASLVSRLAPDTLSIDQVLLDRPAPYRLLRRARQGSFITQCMLAVLAGLLTIPVSSTDTATRIEYAQFDTMFALRGERTPRSDVVIVSIDEPSYSTLSVPLTEMWPRQLHTKLLSRLADDGAKKVVFDILFVDSSADKKIDEELASVMSRVPTVLGAATGFSHQATINGSYMLEEMLKPAPLFSSKAAGIGVVGLPVEFGRVRTVMPPRSEMFPDVPSLAQAASGIDDAAKLPGARALMNFYGASHTIPTISYYMAVADDKPLPKGMFTDKIVFVGLNLKSRTGPSQREAFVTPFDQGTFGTEIQATATSNILSQDWISRLSPRSEVVVAGVVATLFALLLMSSSGVTLIGYLVGSLILVFTAQYLMFLLKLAVPIVEPVWFGIFCGLLFRIMLSHPISASIRRK